MFPEQTKSIKIINKDKLDKLEEIELKLGKVEEIERIIKKIGAIKQETTEIIEIIREEEVIRDDDLFWQINTIIFEFKNIQIHFYYKLLNL